MKDYIAIRYSNVRAEQRYPLVADNDQEALRTAVAVDWSGVTIRKYEPEDPADADAVIDLVCVSERHPTTGAAQTSDLIVSGHRFAECWPYSWDAIALIKELSRSHYDGPCNELHGWIRRAGAVCNPPKQEVEPEPMITIKVNKAQHATMLAALRVYQDAGQGDPANRRPEIHEIATGGPHEEVVSLDEEAIDALCQHINCSE